MSAGAQALLKAALALTGKLIHDVGFDQVAKLDVERKFEIEIKWSWRKICILSPINLSPQTDNNVN